VSWAHGALVSAEEAASLLKELHLKLSHALHESVQAQQPPVVQVWFEPGESATGGQAGPLPLQVLNGRLKLSPQELVWAHAFANTAVLARILGAGGRVLVRLHCGFLFDADRRPFSGTVRALTGLEAAGPPGGVLESWFFARQG